MRLPYYRGLSITEITIDDINTISAYINGRYKPIKQSLFNDIIKAPEPKNLLIHTNLVVQHLLTTF